MKRKEIIATSANDLHSEKRVLDERFHDLGRRAVQLKEELQKVGREQKLASLKPANKAEADAMLQNTRQTWIASSASSTPSSPRRGKALISSTTPSRPSAIHFSVYKGRAPGAG